MRRLASTLALATLLALPARPLPAQILGPRQQDPFHDTSVLKPPPGSPVAVIVFEDLGCPGCARAHPIELQATREFHVPLVRYDLPIPVHIWTFAAAVNARYLERHVSPEMAAQYRTDVFAAQASIANREDLDRFTHAWFDQHHIPVPAVLDPVGALARAVQADLDVARALHVRQTPTVVVVTDKQYQVVCGIPGAANDPTQLIPVLHAAVEQAATAARPTAKHKIPATPAR